MYLVFVTYESSVQHVCVLNLIKSLYALRGVQIVYSIITITNDKHQEFSGFFVHQTDHTQRCRDTYLTPLPGSKVVKVVKEICKHELQCSFILEFRIEFPLFYVHNNFYFLTSAAFLP